MGGTAAQLKTLVAELGNPAFRKLWLSQVVSEIGDWAARLALTTVVFRQTGSATWAAVTAVSALLPMLGPGQLLATFADRADRRVILVAADGVRAVVFAALAVTRPPTPVLLVLSVVAGLATVPFEAARSAATLDVTPAERLPAAMSLGQATQSLALVVGWASGGVLLLAVGTRGALAVNAGTFVVSAAFLTGLPSLRSRHHLGGSEVPSSALSRLASAATAVAHEPLVRRAAAVAVLAVGPAAAVESLVVPYVARAWSAHPSLAAVLLASGAAADLLLTVAIPSSLPPERLLRVAAWCSAGPAVLAALLFSSRIAVLAPLGFVVSALSMTAIAPASAALAPRLPPALRASCFTVLGTGLTLTQVVLSTGGGVVADRLGVVNAARLLTLLPLLAGVTALVQQAPRALPDPDPAT